MSIHGFLFMRLPICSTYWSNRCDRTKPTHNNNSIDGDKKKWHIIFDHFQHKRKFVVKENRSRTHTDTHGLRARRQRDKTQDTQSIDTNEFKWINACTRNRCDQFFLNALSTHCLMSIDSLAPALYSPIFCFFRSKTSSSIHPFLYEENIEFSSSLVCTQAHQFVLVELLSFGFYRF